MCADWRLHGAMDGARRDLIVQLATQAGMLMEDASVVAISLSTMPDADLAQKLGELDADVQIMALLLEAARSLCE